MKKETIKRHIVSALLTFTAAFSIFMLAEIDTITIESFTDGSIMALLFVGVRAGIKAILEYFVMTGIGQNK